MKKSNEILLKEAIGAFLKENRLEEKLIETRLLGAWESVTGRLIARHTEQLYISNHILYVKVDEAALRQELSYQKSKIKAALNKAAGTETIVDIVFA